MNEKLAARINDYWAALGVTERVAWTVATGGLSCVVLRTVLVNGLPPGLPASRVPVPEARR